MPAIADGLDLAFALAAVLAVVCIVACVVLWVTRRPPDDPEYPNRDGW